MDPIYFSLLLFPLLFKKKESSGPAWKKSPGFSFYTNDLNIVDLTKVSDIDIRKFERKPTNIKGEVLHQTGFNWDDDNPNWKKTNTHFVITKTGKVLVLHDPLWRLTHSAEDANENYISVEHEGNYKSINQLCYAEDKFGCDNAPSHEQIRASRILTRNLKASYPNFHYITGHLQWQDGKSNCPGPQIWYNIGEWAKKNLGLSDGGPGWHDNRGMPIPDTWRDNKWALKS